VQQRPLREKTVKIVVLTYPQNPSKKLVIFIIDMPRKFSDFKINCITELLEQGIEPSDVITTVKCSLAKVYQVQRNLNHFNTPRAPKLSAQGRPRKLTSEVLEVSILKLFEH